MQYNTLLNRKETLIQMRKIAFEDYRNRWQQCWHDQQCQESIVTLAQLCLTRQIYEVKMKTVADRILHLEQYHQQLIDSKIDKLKAWENIYTQTDKQDLMDFCLQANIDQISALSFQHEDVYSQPSTPMGNVTSLLTIEMQQYPVTEQLNIDLPMKMIEQNQW
jgi:hypothetical protein